MKYIDIYTVEIDGDTTTVKHDGKRKVYDTNYFRARSFSKVIRAFKYGSANLKRNK